MKYKRKLTDEERSYISNLSVRHPKLAMNAAKTLREQSYHIGGRTVFFTPPNANERPLRKRKKLKRLKFPTMKGKGKLMMSGI
jgi:hypothetical protein